MRAFNPFQKNISDTDNESYKTLTHSFSNLPKHRNHETQNRHSLPGPAPRGPGSLRDRPTNAMRLYAPFQEHPFVTLTTIDKKIRPYVEKLGRKCDYLLSMKQDLMEELYTEMDIEAVEHIQNLNAYFVIGFDCQRNEIKRINTERKEKNKQKEESKL